MKELRDQLIADLEVVGVPVLDDWAIRAEPPCILLTPPLSTSYVTAGQQFASYVLNIDAVVLVEFSETQPDDVSRDQLEDLVEEVLRNTVDWALTGVDSPGTATVPESTITFLGTVIHFGKSLYL
jgi:hypothetical protein